MQIENNPIFSVVIPTYNRGKVICKTINSVIEQMCQDYELIIVDDGSNDDTRAIVEGVDDARIRYIYQGNAGGSKARNTGIDAATGKYVAFLDSDDLFCPHHLENALSAIRETPESCFYTQVIVDRGDGVSFLKPSRAIGSNEHISDYLMRDRGFVMTSTLIVPRILAEKIRYDEVLTFGQDTDFTIRLVCSGARLRMLTEPGAIWMDRRSSKRLSSKINAQQREEWLMRMECSISEHAFQADMGWHVAKGYAQNGRVLKGLFLYLKAVVKGCYKPKLALAIFLQILLPAKTYRNLADALSRQGVTP